MNGRLKTGSQTDSVVLVTLETSMETPVTPPSMKLLESRNPCRPIFADRTPSAIRTMLSSSGVVRVSARRSVEVGTGGGRFYLEAAGIAGPATCGTSVACDPADPGIADLDCMLSLHTAAGCWHFTRDGW